MPASVQSAPPAAATGRHQRSVRNYLLDAHFQLKYTAYLVGITVVLALVLGAMLWRAGGEVIAQSRETVRRGQETVRRGQDVVHESKKVSAVVRMNIAKDPDYAKNPELAALFEQEANKRDGELEEEQKKLQGDAAMLEGRAAELADQQRRMFELLVALAVLLVLGIGVGGIMVTHRVAGPIHKIKRLLRTVGEGHLDIKEKLRKGDELQHFFDAFEQMVASLRARQAAEVARLDAAIAGLEGDAKPGDLGALRALRTDMQRALES